MLHSVANLLQYLCAKNYQNTMRFDKVIAKIKGCSFLPHSLEWFGYPTVKTFDYCNSALAGVARVYFQKLQSVQNMAECADVNTSPQFLKIYIGYLLVSE